MAEGERRGGPWEVDGGGMARGGPGRMRGSPRQVDGGGRMQGRSSGGRWFGASREGMQESQEGGEVGGDGRGPPDPQPTPAVDIMGLRHLLGVTSQFRLREGKRRYYYFTSSARDARSPCTDSLVLLWKVQLFLHLSFVSPFPYLHSGCFSP